MGQAKEKKVTGILPRLGLALTRWTERWVPDSWIIAVILTLVVALLAMTVSGASPATALNAWGNGLWVLLTLAMQFTLMMVVAYACAVSPPIKRVFLRLASYPDPSQPSGSCTNRRGCYSLPDTRKRVAPRYLPPLKHRLALLDERPGGLFGILAAGEVVGHVLLETIAIAQVHEFDCVHGMLG